MEQYFDKEPENRYLLFIYSDHYPLGALSDLHGSYETMQLLLIELKQWRSKNTVENIEVFDRAEGKEINLKYYGVTY